MEDKFRSYFVLLNTLKYFYYRRPMKIGVTSSVGGADRNRHDGGPKNDGPLMCLEISTYLSNF